jgi:hypothetical protein
MFTACFANSTPSESTLAARKPVTRNSLAWGDWIFIELVLVSWIAIPCTVNSKTFFRWSLLAEVAGTTTAIVTKSFAPSQITFAQLRYQPMFLAMRLPL